MTPKATRNLKIEQGYPREFDKPRGPSRVPMDHPGFGPETNRIDSPRRGSRTMRSSRSCSTSIPACLSCRACADMVTGRIGPDGRIQYSPGFRPDPGNLECLQVIVHNNNRAILDAIHPVRGTGSGMTLLNDQRTRREAVTLRFIGLMFFAVPWFPSTTATAQSAPQARQGGRGRPTPGLGDPVGLPEPAFRPARRAGLSGGRLGPPLRRRAAPGQDLVVPGSARDVRQAALPRASRSDQPGQRGGPAGSGVPPEVQGERPVLRLLFGQRPGEPAVGGLAVPGREGRPSPGRPVERNANLGLRRGSVREPQRRHTSPSAPTASSTSPSATAAPPTIRSPPARTLATGSGRSCGSMSTIPPRASPTASPRTTRPAGRRRSATGRRRCIASACGTSGSSASTAKPVSCGPATWARTSGRWCIGSRTVGIMAGASARAFTRSSPSDGNGPTRRRRSSRRSSSTRTPRPATARTRA